MLRTTLAIIMAISTLGSVFSQVRYLQIETDLLEPTAQGINLSLQYGKARDAFSISGTINNIAPDAYNTQHENFEEKRNYQVTLGYNRYFKDEATGFFVGGSVNLTNIIITELASNQKADFLVYRLGIIGGYLWKPWKGLVIVPFLSPRVVFNFDDQSFNSGEIYDGERFQPFGGINLGWRFGL